MIGFVNRKVEEVIDLDKFYMFAYSTYYEIVKVGSDDYKVYNFKEKKMITRWSRANALTSGYKFGLLKKTNQEKYS